MLGITFKLGKFASFTVPTTRIITLQAEDQYLQASDFRYLPDMGNIASK